ncbi:MAG: MBG domain-containing protein, partial [Bacteroidales bacterium]
GSLTCDAGENVGTYAMGQNTLGNSNYTITYVPANLTIDPLAVTVTADAKEKYCGLIDPALTFVSVPAVGTVLANGEVIAFTGSLSRHAGETVGSYAILQGGVANSNYTITYVGGTFLIKAVFIDANASSTPVAIGGTATLRATVLDENSEVVEGVPVSFYLDEDLKAIILTDGEGIATFDVSGLGVGVYKVTAIAGGGCSESIAYLPVYDPDGGFVTGGGWIMSPAGALVTNPAAVGKANFGFVSKYKKGSNQVDGNTEFQFHAGSINFKSSSHTAGTLVIAGAKAIYKGIGTVNGAGNYGFMVSAVDGQISGGGGYDKFRIKIWDKNNSDALVYDNNFGEDENAEPTTLLGGGSIVIHNPNKPKGVANILEAEFGVTAYPNPFTDHLYFDLRLKTDSKVRLEIYDMNGSRLATLFNDVVVAFDSYRIEYTPENLSSGMLIYRLVIDDQIALTGKVIHK